MNWTALSGGLLGAVAGALAGGGIAYAATDEGKHTTPTVVAALAGAVAAGLGGAKLGKLSQYNRWNAAQQLCPAGTVADWATLQCVNGGGADGACQDESIPVNGVCTGLVPNSNLFGAGRAPERLAGPAMRVAKGYARWTIGAGAEHVSTPVRVVPQGPPSPWTAIAAPPAAVEVAVAAGGSGWKDPSVPLPPSSAGHTVYGPYANGNWIYALVVAPDQTGGETYIREQWYRMIHVPLPQMV